MPDWIEGQVRALEYFGGVPASVVCANLKAGVAKALCFAAQLPATQRNEVIGQSTIADAILDRLVHNAHRITLEGDSMRKTRTQPLLTEPDKGETIAV